MRRALLVNLANAAEWAAHELESQAQTLFTIADQLRAALREPGHGA